MRRGGYLWSKDLRRIISVLMGYRETRNSFHSRRNFENDWSWNDEMGNERESVGHDWGWTRVGWWIWEVIDTGKEWCYGFLLFSTIWWLYYNVEWRRITASGRLGKPCRSGLESFLLSFPFSFWYTTTAELDTGKTMDMTLLSYEKYKLPKSPRHLSRRVNTKAWDLILRRFKLVL